ncbi:M24 family metallopeptidase [Pseudoneobacillus sp. C159]
MLKRVSKLRLLMKEKNLSAVLIHSYENRRYFSGFTGSNGYLLVTHDSLLLITDQRYTQQAAEQAKDYGIIVHGIDPFRTIREEFSKYDLERIGFEANHLSVALFNQFTGMFPESNWVPLLNELLLMRSVKDQEEIESIKRSIELSDSAFADLLPLIKPGMTEKEVLVELEYLMGKYGHEGPAFGTIVAADKRAALPHAVPTDNQVKRDHFLLIDFGAKYQGYMSDMTRTIIIGTPDREYMKIYDLVLTALEKSIEAVKPGISAHELDRVARDIFEQAGLEKYSLRGLGHGVGLQIHENPRIVLDGQEILEPGMVFTIEPGLYIPDSVGVRIEDIVLVTEDGCEVLTKTNRHVQLN